jgi:nicotinate-nucleotide adenylyltransferase
MVRLAVAGRPGLEICTLELGVSRPSYTIETLRAMRAGEEPLDPLFIVGADALLSLPTWRDWRELLREFDLVAVDREGRSLDELGQALAPEIRERLAPPGQFDAPGRGGRIFRLRMAPIPVSSSDVRRRAARGESLEPLVPPAVARYIQEAGLYEMEARR